MLRQQLIEELKKAMSAQDRVATSTLRLILAALKDRDIASRSRGQSDGIGEDEILEMLQKMVRQRHESIEMYHKGGRQDLVERERQELEVINRFLPSQLDDSATRAAIAEVIDELEAKDIKDMGKVMSALKSRYTGQMDFRKASSIVKERLA